MIRWVSGAPHLMVTSVRVPDSSSRSMSVIILVLHSSSSFLMARVSSCFP